MRDLRPVIAPNGVPRSNCGRYDFTGREKEGKEEGTEFCFFQFLISPVVHGAMGCSQKKTFS